jgi:hypothetical protein
LRRRCAFQSEETASPAGLTICRVTESARAGVFSLDREDEACKIGEYLFMQMNKYS